MKKYKKIISSVLAAAVTVISFNIHMSADENYIISSDDPRYSYLINENGTISIAANAHSSVSLSGNVTLPSSLDGRTVTGICKNGFSDQENITVVSVPDTITDIGSLAFANCLSLSAVKIPDTITYMGSMPFSGSLYESRILNTADSGFATINDYILYLYTGNAQDIIIPDKIKVIASSAFANNGAYSSEDFEIKSVTIPDGVEYIGDDAFYNCKSLSKVTAGTGLKEIGSNAFSNSPVVMYGYSGTYAQKYAENNSILFVPLIANPSGFRYELEYSDEYKRYYFSTDTSFSREGLKLYKRFYDGSRTEITDWDFASSPYLIYSQGT